MSNEKKHILFLPEWYPNPEDVQLAVFVEKFARAAAINNKVSLIFCGPYAKSNKIELILKKEENLTSYFCYYPKQKRRLKAYNYFLRAHQMCYDKLKEDGIPELVHLHMLFRNYIAYTKIYAKKIKKYLVTEQWSGYGDGTYKSLGFYKKSIYKKAFLNAYFVTAVSKKLAETLSGLFTIQNNIRILPNIAETVPPITKANESNFKILVVADLVDEIKNISGIINAYMQAEINYSSCLTIIGDGNDRQKLESLSNSLNDQSKNIQFKGRLENKIVLEEMLQNDILITNSRHETFSMVTAEALLAGLPVICTKCGGPEEFVNEKNGILINVDDNLALKNALITMSKTYQSYEKTSLSEPVLHKFGIKAVAQQLNSIYEDILN